MLLEKKLLVEEDRHEQVSWHILELEQQIVQGDYQPGDLLPSENQLVETYNVSRETIRKALNLLINAGYIQKNKAKARLCSTLKV